MKVRSTLDVELLRRSDGTFELEDKQSHLASMCGDRFDMGPCAVVRHGGLTILLTSHKTPPFDLGQWRSQGIEPDETFRHRRQGGGGAPPCLRSDRRAHALGRHARALPSDLRLVALSARAAPGLSPRSTMTHPHSSPTRATPTRPSRTCRSARRPVGDLIFVSGQASVDAAGKIVPDTFEGEFRRSLDNLRKVLEAAGSDLAHVVQTRNYVRDAGDVPATTSSTASISPSPFRTRTTITNCLPPALRYEIEGVAVKRPA